MAASDARPVPRKNVAFRVIFPILDADGDLVSGAAGLDTELSGDCGTFADATNEATEIATSSGMYYLDLTAGEMNYDSVAIIVKTSTSGAKTTALTLYPESAGDYRADVTHVAGSAVDTAAAQFGVNVVSKASALDFTTTEKANLATTAEIKAAVAPIQKNVGKTIRFAMHSSTSPYGLAAGATVSVTRSIDGAAFAAGTLGSVAEVANGLYEVDFANADLNGDCVVLYATATGCRPTLVVMYPM